MVCTDENSQITLGVEPVEFEIHGTAHRLTALFTGGTVFGQEVLDGHLYAVGSLEHLAELTGRSIDVLLGRRCDGGALTWRRPPFRAGSTSTTSAG